MTFDQFKKSISGSLPPDSISDYLKALWYDAKGDWEKAHTIIQDIEDLPAGRQGKTASWIHAYLHRKEGDIWNADYWYRRAGRNRPSVSTEKEWEEIVKEIIDF